MPTVSSKERTPEDEAKYRKEADATIAMIKPLVFAIVAGGQLLNQSRPMLVRKIFDGNAAMSAEFLARIAGIGGFAEFILNPVIGRLSDRFGRRPLLLVSPIVNVLLRGGVFAFPHSKLMILCERVFSTAVVTGFFSTMRAMINDKLDGKDLVIAGGAIGVWAGGGVMLGPYIEVLMLRFFGPQFNFALVALVNSVVTWVMYKTAKETLPEEERKPLTIKDCSPLTFFEMIKVGSVNQRLMLVLMLQSFGELRIMQDINMLSLRDNVKWSATEVSNFMAILGASVVIGGKTVKASLQTFGMKGHTTLSNIAIAFAFYAQGSASSKSFFSKYVMMYLSLSMWFIGGRKRDAVETICTDITLKNTDMGKGQVASALSNFKSLAAVFGPSLSAKAYTYGMSRGRPGLPYHFIAILYVLAEAAHLTMSREQMGIKDGE